MSDVKSVPFSAISEPWGQIELRDGTKLFFRTIVSDVKVVDNQKDAEGNPVYQVVTQLICRMEKGETKNDLPRGGAPLGLADRKALKFTPQ